MGSEEAIKLLDDWERGQHELVTPDLLRLEGANALITYNQRRLLPAEKRLEEIQYLARAFRYINEDWALIKHASKLASKLRVTVYEAIYISIATSSCNIDHGGLQPLQKDER
jgi:predicted nucleic acid-binding protein